VCVCVCVAQIVKINVFGMCVGSHDFTRLLLMLAKHIYMVAITCHSTSRAPVYIIIVIIIILV